MVCTVLNATIGTAVVGLGSLLPSQGAFLASTSLLTTRPQQERLRRAPGPVVGSFNTGALEIGCLGSVEAVAGPVTGLASSPPRQCASAASCRLSTIWQLAPNPARLPKWALWHH
ncbi:hypothetical protein WJX75_005819 [Coccomyxa subellipsoidea]|uniref:Uncharacterized protein n=1 Tax=Coccomyxa subellipsoidea TaxID=248742 RepID=A0ABR2YPN3_9CHLO